MQGNDGEVHPFRWVLLRHDEPGGGHHFDWMFEAPGHAGLVTFRLAEVPRGTSFEAERLPDHRREYLQYEGEISGGRGRVSRVEEGWLRMSWTETLTFEGHGGWLRASEWWEGVPGLDRSERWAFGRVAR